MLLRILIDHYRHAQNTEQRYGIIKAAERYLDLKELSEFNRAICSPV